ncbi:uncharacterized protein LOC131312860 [Rhododendron vialii]|uniref:uncharacterized protein LOC131312860 n=1 Tax=Rhododendron vialii TaxID=182163 RepID=UPI00265DC4DE|nr:uncharacterized protein LOC131312860 [Rhododendron vialii]
MNSFALRSQLFYPKHNHLTTPSAKPNPPFLIPVRTTSRLKHHKNPSPVSLPPIQINRAKLSLIHKPQIPGLLPKSPEICGEEFSHVSSNGYSRFVIVGTVAIGLVLLLIGVDEQKALAFGPEGPLMEDFWDNMRRYGLYALTVSTGVIYTLFQPIWELLKNPISAILVLTIFGGSIFIVSQVLNAMVGVSDFSYEYAN